MGKTIHLYVVLIKCVGAHHMRMPHESTSLSTCTTIENSSTTTCARLIIQAFDNLKFTPLSANLLTHRERDRRRETETERERKRERDTKNNNNKKDKDRDSDTDRDRDRDRDKK